MYNFLVNPSSRSGRGRKYWERIKPVLDAESVLYRVIFSERTGHAVEIVRSLCENLAEKEDLSLIILGGDGTVNEALQGIQDFSRVRLGYIPTGSSNDLARDTGISRNPIQALHAILTSTGEIRMDVGEVTYGTAFSGTVDDPVPVRPKPRLYMVSCGIGFDAGVCVEALSSGTKDFWNRLGLGKLTYVTIALKQLIKTGYADATLTVGHAAPVHLRKLMFIAGMNHCYEGGGFCFCPGADATDGLLDLCTVSNVPKWKVLLVLPTAFKGKHYRYKGVERFGGSEVRIQTSAPLWVHTDGETAFRSDDITLRCHRQLVRFIH